MKSERQLKSIIFGEVRPGGGIELMDCGYEHCAAGHYFSLVRTFYLIHIVVSGKGTFILDGKTHSITGGQAFLIRPGQLNSYRADMDDPWFYMWVGFGGEGAESLVAETVGDEYLFDVREETIGEMQRLYASFDYRTEYPYEIVGFVFRLMGTLKADLSASPLKNDVVRSAIRFMENNFFRPFDISWLSGELGMSRSHFTTVFTSSMGTSPYAYLTSYRISRAQSLLAIHPELPITEIAYSVGFASLERFSAAFKKYTGVSPREYRVSHKKIIPQGKQEKQ